MRINVTGPTNARVKVSVGEGPAVEHLLPVSVDVVPFENPGTRHPQHLSVLTGGDPRILPRRALLGAAVLTPVVLLLPLLFAWTLVGNGHGQAGGAADGGEFWERVLGFAGPFGSSMGFGAVVVSIVGILCLFYQLRHMEHEAAERQRNHNEQVRAMLRANVQATVANQIQALQAAVDAYEAQLVSLVGGTPEERAQEPLIRNRLEELRQRIIELSDGLLAPPEAPGGGDAGTA